MSAKPGKARERADYVTHGRPTFFADPSLDKLLEMVTALLGEVVTLRERLDTHERLAAQGLVATAANIEKYAPDPVADKERTALREDALGRVLSVLTEEVMRLRHERRQS